jgi:hypothetical protein
MEKIIKKYYKPHRRGILYGIMFALLICFLAMHLISVILKDPAQKLLAADIKEQILGVDYFSWNVYANIYMVFWTDVCRFAREGWLDPNINADLIDETLWFKCNQMMGFAGDFHVIPDNGLN